MHLKSLFYLFIFLSFVFPSCDFHCSVGSTEEESKSKRRQTSVRPVHQDGAIIYNGIAITTHKVKLNKAYLVFENGEKIPDDNFIEFGIPVKLILLLDSGWTVTKDKSYVGVSEKVVTEDGKVLFNESDLLKGEPEGMDAKDARILGLSITPTLQKGSAPTYLTIFFRAWDKKGDGYVEGSYKIYSK
jgi:hypothetical protein